MDTPHDGPLPREVEEVLKELSAQNFIFGNKNLQLNEAFSKRLEEVSRSVLESPHLSPTLASELRAGFGQNLGAKLVDWVWDSLSPTFKQAPGPNLSPDLIFECPRSLKNQVRSVLKSVVQTYFQETGVHLPQPEFVEGQHVRVRYRSITLGIPSDPSDLVLLEQELLDALYWGASRFLTPHQVKQRLHDLWTQRPELLQMYLEEGVGLTMVLGVLRYLLDRQYSIWDFALIVEEAIFQCRVRSDESVAERVESNLAELLKENRFGPLPPETDERPKGSFDVVCVEMSRDSLFILDPQCSDAFFERMKSLRTRIAQKFGWVVPGVRLRDNFMLPKAEFRICIRGKVVLTGKLRPGLIMAMGSEEMLRQLSGVSCVEPLRGLPCVWISQDSQEHAASLGCLCFTAESVVATALAYLIEENADQLFTLHNVQEALDDLRDSNRPLAEIVEKESELLLLIKDVCCELLAERVPLVDIELIFETVVRERRAELSPFYLAEKVRLRIAHLIYRHHLDANGRLSAFTLAAELEQWCLERLVEGREDTRLELDKVSASLLRDALKELLQSQSESGRDPVLVACPVLRKPLRRFTRQFAPRLTILSEEEVPFDLLDHLGAGGTVAAQWPSRTAKHRPSPGGERRFRRPKKIRKSR